MCATIIPRRWRSPLRSSENNSPDLNKQRDFLLSQDGVVRCVCVCETNRELRDESPFSPDAGEKKWETHARLRDSRIERCRDFFIRARALSPVSSFFLRGRMLRAPDIFYFYCPCFLPATPSPDTIDRPFCHPPSSGREERRKLRQSRSVTSRCATRARVVASLRLSLISVALSSFANHASN